MRATTRLLLATAAALAAIPSGGAHAGPVCARVEVVVPGPVIGVGDCYVTVSHPTYCTTRTLTITGSVGVVVTTCHP